MDFRSLFNLAFLAFFRLSHQALGSSRGVLLPPDDVASPSEGICAAVATVRGYKCQEFKVTTDDGYILSVSRIPEGRRGGVSGQKRPPVLLQHGVLVDGMTWLINSPEESLAMVLADNGFDVWISNLRGSRFSRTHRTLTSSDPDYWDWTWDDLVSYDLPSFIDLIFKQTGQKVHYVGHSMGTLIALASFSEGKQVDKIKSAVMLSPIAYLSYMNTAIGVLSARAFLGEITKLFGLAEFNPRSKIVSTFLRALCVADKVDCYDLMTAFTGKNCCLNASTVDLFLKNEPQSTSTKNLIHMAQTVRYGLLSKYDYGNANFNMVHYGQAKPPVYNLTRIPPDLPLFLSYGGKDALSDVRDVATLLDSLKLHNVGKLHVQYIKDYAHADFILGVTAKDLVYNQMISFFKSVN